MAESSFLHRTRNIPVTVATAVTASSSVDMRDMAGGVLLVSGVTSTHTLDIFVSNDGVSFSRLHATDGSPASISVAGSDGGYYVPDAAYAAEFVRFVSTSAIGTAAAVEISLKS